MTQLIPFLMNYNDIVNVILDGESGSNLGLSLGLPKLEYYTNKLQKGNYIILFGEEG
jgi:hypothetical protein